MTRKLAELTLALVPGTLAFSATAAAQQATTGPQVHDLKFEEGMWYAEAKSANGNRVDLRIDAKAGQAYLDALVSRPSKDDVRAALETQGYTHVHDIDFDDGLWQARARNPAGNRVKLKVDASSGQVIGTY